MFRSALTVCLLLAPLLAAGAESRNYYRYQNESGQTVLDYQVPTEALKRGYQVIDTYGRVVRDVPPPKTAEELEALKRREAARQEQERQAREQAAADRKLLQSYPSESDLTMARNANLTALDDQLRLSRLELERLKVQLERQMAHAARFERGGEEVPASLRAEIESSRQQLKSREQFITEREAQREALAAQFTRDLAHYRALMALPEAERRALLNQPESKPNGR